MTISSDCLSTEASTLTSLVFSYLLNAAQNNPLTINFQMHMINQRSLILKTVKSHLNYITV